VQTVTYADNAEPRRRAPRNLKARSVAQGLLPFGGPNPLGINAALYRHDAGSSTLTALVTPGMHAPGGGQFVGVYFNTNINARGDIVFGGLVSGADIDPNNPPGVAGIGLGLFKADASGAITAVVRPGDPAPGGGVFDAARPGTINNAGDIVFSGHNASLPCIDTGDPFYCGESVYLRDAATGKIIKVAQQGDPAPRGKTYRLAFDGRINARGDVAFDGNVTPGDALRVDVGYYLYNRASGTTTAVAQPGDPMPGGGHFLLPITYGTGNLDLNDRSDVTFGAMLDTDANGDGQPDTGVYLWSNGTLSLIARSGTVIPGVGTLAQLRPPDTGNWGSGAMSNDQGQVFFQGTLTNGTGVLLVATPHGNGQGQTAVLATASAIHAAVTSQGDGTPVAILPSDLVDQLLALDSDAFSGKKKK
jgi:hypothetical protein